MLTLIDVRQRGKGGVSSGGGNPGFSHAVAGSGISDVHLKVVGGSYSAEKHGGHFFVVLDNAEWDTYTYITSRYNLQLQYQQSIPFLW